MTEPLSHENKRSPRGALASIFTRFASVVSANKGPIAFGLRLWLSICVALYVAFWLQLDEPWWAALSAGVVCLPQLGAQLRRSWFRIIGTLVGTVMSLVLSALFPQDRILFFLGLATWGAICAFVISLLRNQAANGAGLAGFTVAVIVGGALGATGGLSGDMVFDRAIARTSEFCIGIFCTAIINIFVDVGDAPRRFADSLAGLSVGIITGFVGTLTRAGASLPDMRPARREFINQALALDPIIDEVLGESSRIRARSAHLYRAMDGLFGALVGWRAVGDHLDRVSLEEARQQADQVLQCLRPAIAEWNDPSRWLAAPEVVRRDYGAAIRKLLAIRADNPFQRLMADKTAEVLASMVHVLTGLLLVVDPAYPSPPWVRRRIRVPDFLPAWLNAGRAFVVIAAVATFWMVTGWPNGASAITFAMVVVIIMGPQGDQAFAGSLAFTAGAVGALILTALLLFVVLPAIPTDFFALSLALGVCLVPIGVLTLTARKPWQVAMLNVVMFTFIPFLTPSNPMTYNAVAYWNQTLITVSGCFAGAFGLSLIPALSPTFSSRCLLRLTLRDLRHLVADGSHLSDWCGRVTDRLLAMPVQSTPMQRAHLLAALSVGNEFIQLKETISHLDLEPELAPALAAMAEGGSIKVIEQLSSLDRTLIAKSQSGGAAQTILRARGSIVVLSEALRQHADYFDDGVLE